VLCEPLRVFGRGRRVGREPRRLRIVVANPDQLVGAAEVARRQLAEVGAEQQVLRLQRRDAALDVLLGEDRDRLLGQPDHRLQRLAPGQRRADVDDDHDVDALRARHVQVRPAAVLKLRSSPNCRRSISRYSRFVSIPPQRHAWPKVSVR
jgi:hypothetical protein